jgi:ADP-ribosyl-[dinitrogen reductase] hydrolase
MKHIQEFRNRAKGAMYGVAVGDALGAPLEFMSKADIMAKHGNLRVNEMLGGGWLNLDPGMTTDDTDMTLAVAEGIMKRYHRHSIDDVVEKVGEGFIAWHHSRPKDIGHTCRVVIEHAEKLALNMDPASAWRFSAELYDIKSNHMSGGNGALMRTAPVGIAYSDWNDTMMAARAIAQMTHWDEKAAVMVGDYSRVINRLVRGADFGEIDRLRLKYGASTKSTGYSFDSLGCALWATLGAEDFEESLVRVVNLGGDADTAGAITGGLVGAALGFGAIPERWVAALPKPITDRIDAFVDWAVRKETERCQMEK